MDDPELHFTDQLKIPGYVVTYPDDEVGRMSVPFVFNSPHSGRHYTAYFLNLSRLSPLLLRKSEDALVDYLFQFAPDLGAPLMAATFPRAYVDLNREPYELDPDLFADPLPDHANSKTIRVASGLGTIARVVGSGLDIYRQHISLEEALWRIENLYKPYHQYLTELINAQVDTFGMSVLIDCHSMPSIQRHLSQNMRPDIVIGDLFGHSANSDYVGYLIELFKEQGLNVAHNIPYAGGFITEHYGAPLEGVHAIQIEINRSLYMDEVLIEPHSGFSELSEKLEIVFHKFVSGIAATQTKLSDAAE